MDKILSDYVSAEATTVVWHRIGTDCSMNKMVANTFHLLCTFFFFCCWYFTLDYSIVIFFVLLVCMYGHVYMCIYIYIYMCVLLCTYGTVTSEKKEVCREGKKKRKNWSSLFQCYLLSYFSFLSFVLFLFFNFFFL